MLSRKFILNNFRTLPTKTELPRVKSSIDLHKIKLIKLIFFKRKAFFS